MIAREVGMIDGEAKSREHPNTFKVPSARDKNRITVGDFVKAGFLTGDPRHHVERMWLIVREIEHGPDQQVIQIVGTLNNDPVVCTHVKDTDLIVFKPKHVIDIIKDQE